jgi:hypothetical protein
MARFIFVEVHKAVLFANAQVLEHAWHIALFRLKFEPR